MRKRIFAVLMMVTMMVTFMPSMSFAYQELSSDTIIDVETWYGEDEDVLTWNNIVFDSRSYLVDSQTGEVKNFAEGFKGSESGFYVELIGKKCDELKYDAMKFELKAEATNGVAIYWKQREANDRWEKYYDSSKVSPKFERSGAEWVNDINECELIPVVKSESKKTKAFSVKLTLLGNGKTIETKTVKFDPDYYEYNDEWDNIYTQVKIGDTYYRYAEQAIEEVKAGQTIKQLNSFSLDYNMPTDKAFTIQGDLDDPNMYITPPDISEDLTLGQKITYKDVNFYSPTYVDVLLDSNTTLINCTASNVYVREDSKDVKLKDVIAYITVQENASVTLAGKMYEGKDVGVGKRSKVDASGLTEYEDVTFYVDDPEHHEVKLPKDDRWYFDGGKYSLDGVYVYNNETYVRPEQVQAAARGDSNPTLKVVGPVAEIYLEEMFDKDASITITGSITGSIDLLSWMPEQPGQEGQNVVVKSGVFTDEYADHFANIIRRNIPNNVSILDYNYKDPERGYEEHDKYCVGGEIIKEVLSKPRFRRPDRMANGAGILNSNYRNILLHLGTDISVDTICNIIDNNMDMASSLFEEDGPVEELKLNVADDAERDLLAVGKEYNQDITKYIYFINEEVLKQAKVFAQREKKEYLSVHGVQLANKKYVVLTDEEYADYQSSWKAVSRNVDQTKVTVKSSALSTSSAKLYANEKGFGVEVAGKNGTVTGLKAGAIKTYTAKPYATVGNGKVKVYGDSQKVVVKSKAYTPTVKAGKKSIKVSFNKMSGAKKYQISVSRSKTKTNVKSSSTKRSLKLKNLKSNKTYYVKVRTVNSKGVKGAWSVVKAVKVK